MKYIVYRDSQGIRHLVVPAPKEHLERLFGSMTDQQYRDHVFERSIPQDATEVLEVDEIPKEFNLV